MSDKRKRKIDSDDEETGEQVPSSSPSIPSELTPENLSETRESSQKTAGDLHSDAGKQKVEQPIIKLKDKSKRIKYLDDDQKETPDKTDDKTGEQIPSSSASVPSGLTSEDLSNAHMAYEQFGRGTGNLGDYIKQQQEALSFHEQFRNYVQKSLGPSGSSQKKTKGDPEGISGRILEDCKKLQEEAQRLEEQLNISFHMLSDTSQTEAGVLENLMQQQQTALWLQEHGKKFFGISHTSESSQKTTEGCLEGIKTGNLDLDAKKEELDQPIKELEGKCKQIKYSDDHQKEIPDKIDDKIGEQIPSSSPSVPSGLTSEDLSSVHPDYELYGRGARSLEDYIKQQQEALLFHEQNRNKVQMSLEPREYSDSDSNTESEELEPMEDLIFELEIKDTNRLVIPYDTAAGNFPSLFLRDPIAVETLQLTDPQRRDWEMTLTYDGDTHSYVITQGLSLYLEHYHLNPPDMIQVYLPLQQLHSNHFYIQHQKNLRRCLFEVQVPRTNRLPISCDLAGKYFNPSKATPPADHLHEYPLHLIDHLDRTWEMRFVYFEDEQAYVVLRGWEQYVAHYGVNPKDKIRFFEQTHSTEENSFLIFHEPGPVTTETLLTPLCLRMNLMCQLDLTRGSVESGRLEMPGVHIAFLFRGREMVKLSDMNNKNWYVIIKQVGKGYVIMDGWEGYVKEHELEIGDMVRLYYPGRADHEKQFLIECFSKNKKTEKEEEKGGKGSGSRKGKEKL